MLKFAITGAGFISNIHAQAVKAIPGVELVAVVDRSLDTAGKFAQKYAIKDYCQTVAELLKRIKLDALIVGTPNYLHEPQTIAALKAGVHVMVEKPMAMNANEASRMLEVSQKSGALLMVAHCWRFDPEVLWLSQQADSGRLGRIVRTKGYGVHQLWGPSGWFTQRRYAGGGAMADMGIHALDTARFLLNDPEPESVFARIGTYYSNYDVDDTGILLVNWTGGATSYIEAGWWQPHTDGPEAATQLYGSLGFGQIFPTFLKDQNGKEDPGYVFPRQEHCPQSLFDQQMAYFVHCIQNNQPPSPGGMEGLVNMRVIDAALKSARTGRMVKVS